MARIIGIDYGTKRVGLAVTDPLQIIASALETVHAKDLLAYLKEYCAREEVEAFVLGMPRKTDNTPSENAQHVVGFQRKLQEAFPDRPVHLVDERFTSSIAQQSMISAGLKKKDRQNKATVDKVSAVIILQSYLESRQFAQTRK